MSERTERSEGHERMPQEGTSTPTSTSDTPARKPRGTDSVRGWFGRLPWPVRTVIIIALAALAYLLPYVGQVPIIGPQIVTQGIDWPSALFNMSYYVLLALGLNVVVGYAGLLDLGYVGLLRRRRVRDGVAHLAGQRPAHELGLAGIDPGRAGAEPCWPA